MYVVNIQRSWKDGALAHIRIVTLFVEICLVRNVRIMPKHISKLLENGEMGHIKKLKREMAVAGA
jgi:hypothetical protein